MRTKYPYVAVRTENGVEVFHEDVFYDALTDGPWRKPKPVKVEEEDDDWFV